MIRSFLPTDLVLILVGDGSLLDRARPRDRLGGEGARIATLCRLLLQRVNPRYRRYTWVRTENMIPCGLASVRDRSVSTSWEIDSLMLREQDIRCCTSLLERLSSVALDRRIETIFLRLAEDSPFAAAAKGVGFAPYMIEDLYWRQGGGAAQAEAAAVPAVQPRRRQASDDYRLFELYERRVPLRVRKTEGSTFREWQASRERHGGVELVFEAEGCLSGWLSLGMGRGVGWFDVMAASDEDMLRIVGYALKALSDCRDVFCLVAGFDTGLARALESNGFSRVGTYSSMVKELSVKESEPCLVPLMPAGA